MSIPVALPDLAATLAQYRFAYLLAANGGGAPRVVAVNPVLENNALVISGLGQRTCACIAANPQVALVWPPAEATGHSLICDGTATAADSGLVRITPSSAVLHRPAAAAPANDTSA